MQMILEWATRDDSPAAILKDLFTIKDRLERVTDPRANPDDLEVFAGLAYTITALQAVVAKKKAA
jgi:hypothetical protein